MMKKRILIVYNTLGVGGSTTSLLSLLNELDLTKYDVDLQLRGNGEFDSLIPQGINRQPDYMEAPGTLMQKKRRSFHSWLHLLNALFRHKVYGNLNQRTQIMSLDSLRYCKDQEGCYDVAIS